MAEESNKMGKTKTVLNVKPKPRGAPPPLHPILQQQKYKDTKSYPQQQSPVVSSTVPWKSTSTTPPPSLPQSFKDIQAEQKKDSFINQSTSKVWSKNTPPPSPPPPIGASNLSEIMSEQFIEKMVKNGE